MNTGNKETADANVRVNLSKMFSEKYVYVYVHTYYNFKTAPPAFVFTLVKDIRL